MQINWLEELIINKMENISLKLEKEFRKTMEEIMKKHNYMTKTEFIREAIREKIKKLEEKETSNNLTSERKKSEVKEFPSYI